MQNLTEKPLDRLTRLLSITIDDLMQDWDIECADPNRVDEFCQIYEREKLNYFEKTELMSLIVASYDESLREEKASTAMWEKVANLLKRDYDLHKNVIEYWSLLDEVDEENMFPVTPLIREIWQSCNGNQTL